MGALSKRDPHGGWRTFYVSHTDINSLAFTEVLTPYIVDRDSAMGNLCPTPLHWL
jgi:hypothetical protein